MGGALTDGGEFGMAQLSREERQILEALGGESRQGQTLRPGTLGDESGLRVEDVRAALERLQELGYVSPTPAGPSDDAGNTRWSLLPKGREAASKEQ